MNTYNIPPNWLGREIRIALVGCGGTGSEMFDELYRIHSLLIALGGEGINVTAFDPDMVSQANVGRQRFWPADIGYPKAEILVNRVNSFGGTDWQGSSKRFGADELSGGFDIIVTCVDSAATRAEIGSAISSDEDYDTLLWLDCGNDAYSGNVIFGHLIADHDESIRLPNVFDLYPMLATMTETNEPSCSTLEALEKQDYGINRSVAREGANLLWQLLRHGCIRHHGSFIDIRSGTVNPLMIDEHVWSTFTLAA